MSSLFDRFPQSELKLLGQLYPSYQVLGVLGVFTGFGLMVFLSILTELETAVTALLVLLSCLLFLAGVMVNKMFLGSERIALFEQLISVVLGAAGFLLLFHRPVLPYLDVLTIGLALFLAFGRMGCFMAGCCHGRPHRFGVHYGPDYEDAGLDTCYLSTRLFPIQLFEAVIHLLLTIIGTVILLSNGYTPGLILWGYLLSYGFSRFLLEFARGDTGRPYWKGLSVNQWICLSLVWIGALAGSSGIPGWPLWPIVIAFLLTEIGLCQIIIAHRNRGLNLYDPRPLLKVFRTFDDLEKLKLPDGKVALVTLFEGLYLGFSSYPGEKGREIHYSFKITNGSYRKLLVKKLAALAVTRHGCGCSRSLIPAEAGLFHLHLIRPNPLCDLP